jgi:MFS family permease
VFVTRAMMMLALYTLFTFVEYYVRDVLKVTQFVQGAAVIAGLATLTAVVGGVLTGWLSDRTGRKPIVSAAGILMAALLAVLAFVHNWDVVLVVGVGFGIALGAFSAVDWALAIDVLPDPRFIAKDLGLWGISTNLPQTVAPLVGGIVLTVLAPFGESVGFAVLFLGAASCAALSSMLVWRLRTVR